MSPAFQQALYVGSSSIEAYDSEPWESIERDPRGLLLCWEAPEKKAQYIVGMDTAEGIVGWSRATRTESDHKTDNSAIEVFKVDGTYELLYRVEDGHKVPDIDSETKRQRRLYRDVQVAEWAGPVDPVDASRIANVIGRIYRGSEDDAAELIYESWPGCGLLATQELLRLGFPSLWLWEYIDSAVEQTNRIGWRSTRESTRLLWQRARRHLLQRKALIRSKYLLHELSNAEIDADKMRARAAYGYHDDRMQAASMCFWAGHKWTYDIETTHEPVTTTPTLDFQRYAPTLDDDNPTYSDWRENFTADW